MANLARAAMDEREVEVDRLRLIKTLKSNREKHIKDYEEAREGYVEQLSARLEAAHTDAKMRVEKEFKSIKARVKEFTADEITKQRDSFVVMSSIVVEMPVPRSFAEEYDAAIDMMEWEVGETVKLTAAEFTCFVRDKWDWKTNFLEISMQYKKSN